MLFLRPFFGKTTRIIYNNKNKTKMIGQDSELSYFLQLILTFNATKNIRATNLCLNQENPPSGEDFILHEDGSGIVTV